MESSELSTLSMEEALAMIDEKMKDNQVRYNIKNNRPIDAPVDPAMLTVCDGCE